MQGPNSAKMKKTSEETQLKRNNLKNAIFKFFILKVRGMNEKDKDFRSELYQKVESFLNGCLSDTSNTFGKIVLKTSAIGLVSVETMSIKDLVFLNAACRVMYELYVELDFKASGIDDDARTDSLAKTLISMISAISTNLQNDNYLNNLNEDEFNKFPEKFISTNPVFKKFIDIKDSLQGADKERVLLYMLNKMHSADSDLDELAEIIVAEDTMVGHDSYRYFDEENRLGYEYNKNSQVLIDCMKILNFVGGTIANNLRNGKYCNAVDNYDNNNQIISQNVKINITMSVIFQLADILKVNINPFDDAECEMLNSFIVDIYNSCLEGKDNLSDIKNANSFIDDKSKNLVAKYLNCTVLNENCGLKEFLIFYNENQNMGQCISDSKVSSEKHKIDANGEQFKCDIFNGGGKIAQYNLGELIVNQNAEDEKDEKGRGQIKELNDSVNKMPLYESGRSINDEQINIEKEKKIEESKFGDLSSILRNGSILGEEQQHWYVSLLDNFNKKRDEKDLLSMSQLEQDFGYSFFDQRGQEDAEVHQLASVFSGGNKEVSEAMSLEEKSKLFQKYCEFIELGYEGDLISPLLEMKKNRCENEVRFIDKKISQLKQLKQQCINLFDHINSLEDYDNQTELISSRVLAEKQLLGFNMMIIDPDQGGVFYVPLTKNNIIIGGGGGQKNHVDSNTSLNKVRQGSDSNYLIKEKGESQEGDKVCDSQTSLSGINKYDKDDELVYDESLQENFDDRNLLINSYGKVYQEGSFPLRWDHKNDGGLDEIIGSEMDSNNEKFIQQMAKKNNFNEQEVGSGFPNVVIGINNNGMLNFNQVEGDDYKINICCDEVSQNHLSQSWNDLKTSYDNHNIKNREYYFNNIELKLLEYDNILNNDFDSRLLAAICSANIEQAIMYKNNMILNLYNDEDGGYRNKTIALMKAIGELEIEKFSSGAQFEWSKLKKFCADYSQFVGEDLNKIVLFEKLVNWFDILGSEPCLSDLLD
jgi:hypothetical protein